MASSMLARWREAEALADELLSGAATLARPGLLANLRRAVLDKCAVDSPKYAALAAALLVVGVSVRSHAQPSAVSPDYSIDRFYSLP